MITIANTSLGSKKSLHCNQNVLLNESVILKCILLQLVMYCSTCVDLCKASNFSLFLFESHECYNFSGQRMCQAA